MYKRQGINSFDASKGTKLATYAARCVENEILMMLRSRKKNQNDVSLNDSIGTDKEGNAIMLMDVIENDDEDIFEEIQSGDRIKTLYKNIKYNLTPRERKDVYKRQLSGLAERRIYILLLRMRASLLRLSSFSGSLRLSFM